MAKSLDELTAERERIDGEIAATRKAEKKRASIRTRAANALDVWMSKHTEAMTEQEFASASALSVSLNPDAFVPEATDTSLDKAYE